MSASESLDLLVDLVGHREQLQRRFPLVELSYQPTNLLVVSANAALADDFLEALRSSFSAQLEAAQVQMLPPVVLPQTIPESVIGEIHSCWFLFPADRFDLRSRDFEAWAGIERHHRLLTSTKSYGFRIFPGEVVERWVEPIAPIRDETVLERPILVSSIAIERSRRAAFGVRGEGRQITDLVGRVLLFLLAGRHDRYGRMVAGWDRRIAGLLGQRAQAIRNAHGDAIRPVNDAIEPVLRLFDLHRATGEASRAIEDALEVARELDRRATEDLDLQRHIDEITARLNDARLSADDFLNEGVAFTEEFQILRARLLALAERFTEGLDSRGLPKHAELLRGSKQNLERTLTVVLLGAFSSGKSTFINSILRLETDPLSTSGKPETATINILEYAEEECVKIKFADEIDLPLLSRPRLDFGGSRYLIHKVEIRALMSWVEDGFVDLDAAEIEIFIDPDKPRRLPHLPARLGHNLLKKLQWLLDIPDTTEEARRLAREQVPRRIGKLTFIDHPQPPRIRAAVQEWVRHPEVALTIKSITFRRDIEALEGASLVDTPGTDSAIRAAVQEWVRHPEVALTIKSITFRRDIKALEGASLVDTPGTDSAIPHHHTLARRFLEHRSGSPVLYCFDGTRVCSEADSENIEFLKELRGEKERIFFLITKRELCVHSQQDEAEIRSKVKRLLGDSGFAGHKAYFIDAVQIRDGVEQPEWTSLVEKLRSFVDHSRTQVLRADADSLLMAYIRQLRDEAEEQLRVLDQTGRDSKRQAETVENRLAGLRTVRLDLVKKTAEARQRLFKHGGSDFDRWVEEVREELSSADTGSVKRSTRDQRIQDMREIVEDLDPWPKRLKANLRNASKFLHGFVTSELGTLGVPTSDARAKGLPAEFAVMELADIHGKAKENVTEREWMLDGWALKCSFRKGLNRKRDRLRWMIEEERKRAKRVVECHFDDEIASHYRSVLDAHHEALNEQLRVLRDGKKRAEMTEMYKERRVFLDQCVEEWQAVVGHKERGDV